MYISQLVGLLIIIFGVTIIYARFSLSSEVKIRIKDAEISGGISAVMVLIGVLLVVIPFFRLPPNGCLFMCPETGSWAYFGRRDDVNQKFTERNFNLAKRSDEPSESERRPRIGDTIVAVKDTPYGAGLYQTSPGAQTWELQRLIGTAKVHQHFHVESVAEVAEGEYWVVITNTR